MNKLIASFISFLAIFSASAEQVVTEVSGNALTVFLPADSVATGKAVMILPGGGYSHLAMNHEGLDWGQWMADRGITAAVFAYPMPKGDKELPLAAVKEGLKALRDNARQWRFNPDSLGIMGSSAGGHLASTVATHLPAEMRPAFQILFYPVITMDSTLTHRGSRTNLLGKSPKADDVRLYSNELRTDSLTPRAFIALSGDDKAVPPANSLSYYDSLTRNGVSASLHIYPTGGHGWGFRPRFLYHDVMTQELARWLESF